MALPMLSPLPIDAVLPEIEASLRASPNLVLVAEPGAGKTTRVPAFLLERGLVPDGQKILVLQPRRLAARAVAARIAEERAWELGGEVGYNVRFESRFRASTRLLVMTEGILTRRLLTDSELRDVGAVVLDEFHERSLHTDLALALLKEIQGALRPDLKIIVMSATLETSRLAEYLPDARVLSSAGRAYPVRTFRNPELGPRDRAPDIGAQVERAIADLRREQDDGGHALVFLPGVGEIRRVADHLGGVAALRGFEIFELHGSLGLAEQARVLAPAKPGQRRIVLSTNIAETSLTVPGVTMVVDSGLARVLRFDPARGFDRLEVSRISRASATQRAGRAGRERPGKVFQLWSAEENARLRDFEDPEIRRVGLSATLLLLASWGVRDFAGFGWFEAPKSAQIETAVAELRGLGALDAKNALTARGERLRDLPLSPRFGVALLNGAERGEAARVALALALLEEKDPVYDLGRLRGVVASERECDLELRLEAIELAEVRSPRELGIDANSLRRVRQVAQDLERSVSGRDRRASTGEVPIAELLWPAFSDRLCRRRQAGGEKAVMVGGRGLALSPDSDVRRSDYFLALDLLDTGQKAESRVRIASGLSFEELQAWAGAEVREEIRLELGEDFKPAAQRSVRFRDLVLSGPFPTPLTKDLAAHADEKLVDALVREWPRFVAAQSALAGYLLRREFVRSFVPEAGIAELDETVLGEWAEALVGARGNQSLRDIDAWSILSGLLPRAERQAVEAEAPDRQLVPSGREMRLEYGTDLKTVTCSVKLQELFGLAESPKILRGRVPLTLELLSPGQKPVQVTQDLASFWQNGYPEVRKELRARYPRHPWPEDPWTATATHRAKPRGT